MYAPSPLHAAIQERELPAVLTKLTKHGADCNTRYSDGQTALHYAVTEGSLDIVGALVEEGGASLDVRDDYGRTALTGPTIVFQIPIIVVVSNGIILENE
jgi:ankyrin repeat protein